MENKQPELRYKDGTPMRKYNSLKLKAIEMENKQTAVEWLVEMLIDNKYLIKDATHLFEQAKKKETHQIMDAYTTGYSKDFHNAQNYYDLKYGK